LLSGRHGIFFNPSALKTAHSRLYFQFSTSSPPISLLDLRPIFCYEYFKVVMFLGGDRIRPGGRRCRRTTGNTAPSSFLIPSHFDFDLFGIHQTKVNGDRPYTLATASATRLSGPHPVVARSHQSCRLQPLLGSGDNC
jgi:hypothetical protein